MISLQRPFPSYQDRDGTMNRVHYSVDHFYGRTSSLIHHLAEIRHMWQTRRNWRIIRAGLSFRTASSFLVLFSTPIFGVAQLVPTTETDSPFPQNQNLLSFHIAENELFAADNEYPWLGDFGHNLRLTVDLSTRALFNTKSDEWSSAYFVGLDVYKVLTGPDGDWGTMTLQPYLTHLDNFQARPAFFEDPYDWELVFRIFNFNYTGLAKGKLNLRVGHFEIPFGLEQVVNTNGTLRDFIHEANIGVKTDWGVTINGVLPDFEYELSWSRGTGNEWSSRGDPFVVAGRIASPPENSLSAGISALYGDVQNTSQPNDILRRKRVGVDLIYEIEQFTIMGEFSYGENKKSEVYNAILELDWHSPTESWLIYNQVVFFNNDTSTGWDDSVINKLGVRWAPDTHWSFSGQWSQDLTAFGNAGRKAVFTIQARYRF